MAKSLNNEAVVTLALYELGGILEPVHTEEIAVRAFELSPNRFRWKLDKYKGRVNLAFVYSALSDARKAETGALIIGSIEKGWLLTDTGKAVAEACTAETGSQLDTNTVRDPEEKKLRAWQNRQSSRLQLTRAFEKFLSGDVDQVTEVEIKEFFEVDDYLVRDTQLARITRFLNVFGRDEMFGEVVNILAKMWAGEK